MLVYTFIILIIMYYNYTTANGETQKQHTGEITTQYTQQCNT